MTPKQKQIIVMVLAAIGLLVTPLILQGFGNAWVRIADMALLYVLLALGLNIVVGYAGLLDLGYVAFFAIGAYMYALLASPHLTENFPAFAAMFPNGLHTNLADHSGNGGPGCAVWGAAGCTYLAPAW